MSYNKIIAIVIKILLVAILAIVVTFFSWAVFSVTTEASLRLHGASQWEAYAFGSLTAACYIGTHIFLSIARRSLKADYMARHEKDFRPRAIGSKIKTYHGASVLTIALVHLSGTTAESWLMVASACNALMFLAFIQSLLLFWEYKTWDPLRG